MRVGSMKSLKTGEYGAYFCEMTRRRLSDVAAKIALWWLKRLDRVFDGLEGFDVVL